jgi:hypothetical protein
MGRADQGGSQHRSRPRSKSAGVSSKRSPEDLQTIILILEDKRAGVMANESAGYFIHDWQELRDQVRRLILADGRYKAIKNQKK